MVTNEQRAAWGEAAVKQDPDFGENDIEISVTDTLSNIMHYCEHKGIDFDTALDDADTHFSAERPAAGAE